MTTPASAQGVDTAARTELLGMVHAYRMSQVVHAAVKLGVADVVANRPASAEDLARAVGADGPALYRLVRALVSLGVLESPDGRHFVLTSLGQWLRSDRPDSVSPIARLFGLERLWLGWGRLTESVISGRPSAGPRSERSALERHVNDPEAGHLYDAAMTAYNLGHVDALLDAYDFSPFRRVVDVGGGRGTLLAAILARCRSARGVLFDLPPVVAGGRATLEAAGLIDRCDLVGGDCFEGVPPDGDLYILKAIVHNWDDARSRVILRHCRRGIAVGGRLLIVERVVPEALVASARMLDAALSDLTMLALTGGRERTLAEFHALLENTGLRVIRVIPTAVTFSIVEAVADA